LAKRHLIPIERLPLVGGSLCLDFVNTTGARQDAEPRERLASYLDLMVFCRRSKLFDETRAGDLRREARKRPVAARQALSQAIALREALYRIFRAAATRGAVAKSDLARFNTEWAKTHRDRQLVWTRGRPRWNWATRPTDLAQMIAPILFAAAELLDSTDLNAVKQCGECDWLFVDTTKNHSRRWCKAACGDRVKARRYYRRHKSNKE